MPKKYFKSGKMVLASLTVIAILGCSGCFWERDRIEMFIDETPEVIMEVDEPKETIPDGEIISETEVPWQLLNRGRDDMVDGGNTLGECEWMLLETEKMLRAEEVYTDEEIELLLDDMARGLGTSIAEIRNLPPIPSAPTEDAESTSEYTTPSTPSQSAPDASSQTTPPQTTPPQSTPPQTTSSSQAPAPSAPSTPSNGATVGGDGRVITGAVSKEESERRLAERMGGEVTGGGGTDTQPEDKDVLK